MKYNEFGEEINDEPAVEIPLRLRRPATRSEEIMRAVRVVLSQQAGERGAETFEEANDFDIEDEGDEVVLSGRQAHLMGVDELERRDRDEEYLDRMTMAERRRHDRIEARLLKEGRGNESQSSEGAGVADRAGAAGAGERADASGGARDGVQRA